MTSSKIIRLPAAQQIPQIMAEMQTAAETLDKIGWGVSVFGSARIKPDTPYYNTARQLGARLAQLGVPVIAGGGPGLMEATNRGAYEANGTSIGLNILLPREKSANSYQTHSLYFDYFYSRKATFFMHSAAYITLPGGWGTLDEVFEVMTLVQTRKVPPAPIILIGTEFWAGLMDWVRDFQVAQGMVGEQDLDLLTLTDDLDEVIALIERFFQTTAQAYSQQEAALPE